MNTNPEHLRYMPGYHDDEPAANKTPEERVPEAPQEQISHLKEVKNEPPTDSSRDIEVISLPDIDWGALDILNNVTSPFLVPTYFTLAIFWFSILAVVAPGAILPYALTVFGATGIVPFLSLFILRRMGLVESFRLFKRRERVVPYVVEILALGGITLFYAVKGAAPWIWTIYCGATAATLLNFLVNFRFRISCHCTAMGALLAALIVIQNYGLPQVPLLWWIVGVVAFAGLSGTMAIIFGRHTLWEVFAGYASGFLGIILFSLIK